MRAIFDTSSKNYLSFLSLYKIRCGKKTRASLSVEIDLIYWSFVFYLILILISLLKITKPFFNFLNFILINLTWLMSFSVKSSSPIFFFIGSFSYRLSFTCKILFNSLRSCKETCTNQFIMFKSYFKQDNVAPSPLNKLFLFELDFNIKFTLLRLLLFLSDLKRTIFVEY